MTVHKFETLPNKIPDDEMPGGIIGLYPDNHKRPVTAFDDLGDPAVSRIIGVPYKKGDPLPEQLTPDQRRLLKLERDAAAAQTGDAMNVGIRGLLAAFRNNK